MKSQETSVERIRVHVKSIVINPLSAPNERVLESVTIRK